jgi:ribonuclease BN (tRNA processing enzyme)
VRLTILGSNGTYGTPSRPPSGYLVDHEGVTLWVDAGPGTLAALQEYVDLADVDGVVLSHVHADHCLDIFGFYHALRFGRDPRSGVPAFVPEGLEERLVAFAGGGDHPISEVLDFRTMSQGGNAQIGGMSLTFAETDHPVPTLCVRVEANGRSLTYSADTGPGGGLSALAERTHLLLCEATYQGSIAEKPWPHHLTAGEAGALAREARADRLMVTHIWPTLDPTRSVAEAEDAFGRPVSLAVPGMRIKV